MARRLQAKTRESAAANESFVLGRAESSHDAALARIGADLTAAARNSGAEDTLKSSALRSLRQSFRAARQEHGAYVEAEAKVAACLAGRYRIQPLGETGRLRCIHTRVSSIFFSPTRRDLLVSLADT